MLLPIFQKDMSLMQTKWKSILDPIIANSSLQNIILPNISLISGINHINHKLGRNLIGWRIIRLRNNAVIFDNQDSNQTPQFTLDLTSNIPSVVDLEVF